MFFSLIIGAFVLALVSLLFHALYSKVKRQSSRFSKSVQYESTSLVSDASALISTSGIMSPSTPDHHTSKKSKVKTITLSPSTPTTASDNTSLERRKSRCMSLNLNANNMESTYDLRNKNLSMVPNELKNDFEISKTFSHLDLSENRLSVLPAWFFTTGWANNITTLDLSHNKFFEVQNGISKLENLQYLDLSFNRIENFPSVLISCQKLISLDLSNNQIVFLSPDISKLQNLKELDISNNSLSMLPASMVELNKLDSLFIQNNKFIDSIHHILSELQKRNEQLKISQIDSDQKQQQRQSIIRKTIKDRVRSKQDRMHALKEIVKSETQYNKFLNLLVYQYYFPFGLKQKTEGAKLNFNSVANIPDEVRRAMFPPGLQTIANFNDQLLKELQQNINLENEDKLNDSMVGDIFLERAAFFKVYTNYISGYHNAHRTLMNNIQSNEDLAKIIQKGRSLPDANGVDLPSLLIMPIQRIPRYVLLLKAILDNTDSFHPDYHKLEKAVSSMSDIAAYVNKKIAEAANLRKVMDIQQELNFEDLVAPHRTFVKEGKLFLKKKDQDRSAENQVKIHLFNDLLILTEFKLLYALFGDFVRRFELQDIEVRNGVTDTEFDIIVKHRDKHYQLRADNASQRDDWVNLINKYREETAVDP